MFKFTYRVTTGNRYFTKAYDGVQGPTTYDASKALTWKTRSAAERYAKRRRDWQHTDIADSIVVVSTITKEEAR